MTVNEIVSQVQTLFHQDITLNQVIHNPWSLVGLYVAITLFMGRTSLVRFNQWCMQKATGKPATYEESLANLREEVKESTTEKITVFLGLLVIPTIYTAWNILKVSLKVPYRVAGAICGKIISILV